MMAMALAGCADAAPGDATPSASQSTVVAEPGYELPEDLCAHVDLAPVTAVLPYLAEQPEPRDSPLENDALCNATLGVSPDADQQGSFSVVIQVFEDEAAAADYYDAFYLINKNSADATDVAVAGQKAYQFVVPGIGAPTVTAIDRNAVISARWFPEKQEAPLPDGIFEALTETIRGTLMSLRDA
jgi:hypothetical protein